VEEALANEIIASLPRGRTLFRYFRNRYALMLLQHASRLHPSVSDIKSTRFAGLLRKTVVRDALNTCGDGRIDPAKLDAFWPADHRSYRLTLARWPESGEKWDRYWHQTSRRGVNLVLQLNFSISHNRLVESLTREKVADLGFTSHPINDDGELTLAWSRIDLNLQTGEALIEEIQSDWVRDAVGRADAEQSGWTAYTRHLQPHARDWDETMLAATVWFLLEEIGIRTIFYHTFETGSALKHIQWSHPPRSLYTDLPRRFCFEITHNGPLFLRDEPDRRLRKLFREPDTRWYCLDLAA